MIQRPSLFGALVACALLAASVDARAGYSFTTGTVTANPLTIGGTVTDTFTSLNSSSPTDQAANYNFVTINYSNLTTTPTSGTQTLSWVETLVSTTTGATGTFSIVGTLSVVNATNSGVPAGNFVNFSITPFGAGTGGFQLGFTGYNAGTFSTSAGTATANLAFNVFPPTAPSTVPEPASVAILGAGLIGVLGLGLRCRKKTLSD
jgi:hypothetical protein